MVFSIYQMGRIVLSDRNTNIVDEGSLVTDCGSVAQCSVTAVYISVIYGNMIIAGGFERNKMVLR